MTDDDVRALLRRRSKKEGPTRWAKNHDILKSRVSEFLSGKRPANDAILDALGLERRIVRKRRDRDAALRRREAAEAEGQQPGPECSEGIAQPFLVDTPKQERG